MSDNKTNKKSSDSSKRSPSIIIGIVLIIMTIGAGVMIHRYETKHGRSGNQTNSEKSDDKYSDAEDASIDTDKSYPNAYSFLSTKSGKQHIANHTDRKVGNTGKTVYEANCYVADYVDGN